MSAANNGHLHVQTSSSSHTNHFAKRFTLKPLADTRTAPRPCCRRKHFTYRHLVKFRATNNAFGHYTYDTNMLVNALPIMENRLKNLSSITMRCLLQRSPVHTYNNSRNIVPYYKLHVLSNINPNRYHNACRSHIEFNQLLGSSTKDTNVRDHLYCQFTCCMS